MKQLPFLILFFACLSAVAQVPTYDQILKQYATTQNFNGTVLVAKNGQIKYLNAAGVANRKGNTPLSTKTKFKICSITKTFTVALLLQLHEEGKLDLTQTIGKFLPEYTGEARDKVTLHHLITYSSGIPNCEGGKGLAVYQAPISTDAFIEKYCSGKLEFLPGTRFNYENGSYIILGCIIEKVTGKSFGQNLETRILKPLGMKNTGYFENSKPVKNLAKSYLYNDSTKAFENDPPYFIQNYFASAAMYSTVEDLLKFDQAIFHRKLFSRQTLDLMLTPYPKLWSVAYGFWVSNVKLGEVSTLAADRQGAIMGSNTSWLHLIKENITVIVFSNTNATNINELREKLALAAMKQ